MAYTLTLGAISFLLTVVWGRPFIRLLRRWNIGEQIRAEEPETRQMHVGTPTMGGILIVVPVLLLTGLLNVVNVWFRNVFGSTIIGHSTLLLVFCMSSFALLGAVDDWQGICQGRTDAPRTARSTKGMRAPVKFAFQLLFATIIALVLYYGPPQLDFVGIPGHFHYVHIGWLFMPVAVLIIVGFSNAVNFTDGLDSLAGSSSSIAFAGYGLIAFLQDQIYLAAFCFIVVGALLAFLWHNAHPAEMIMGDTGSLALGATLGLVALMSTQWLLLPIIGLVFVAEAGSVMLQVCYFKLTKRLYGKGRRIFRMSPLHYHFELAGWSPMQVKERFWIVGVLSSMAGVALALQ